ncbi:MAG TPA: PEP-utilizing enzyme [Thermoanaerobaculia bacterium]|jgi:pyruvate,water dikinase
MQSIGDFKAPGPGVWELERTHMTRPITRAMETIMPAAAMAGFRATTSRYGLLLDYLEFGIVNRFIYICPRPVGAPKGAKGPPPKLIFQALTKLHPEVRKRIRTSEMVFATKLWREDLARWDDEVKPAIIRQNRELQAVDARALSDAELAAHVRRCCDAVTRAITTHHSFNATAMLPLGDFLVHVRDWTGLAPSAVLPLFRGASRVSNGAADELAALVRALAAHADAATLLAGSDPRAIIDALTARTDAAGAAARAYVDAAGVRIATGYDLADLTIGEMPELLVENIRASLGGGSAQTRDDVIEREAALRERVPAQHRQRFDELLAEARAVYRLRDERTYENDTWSAGITRRALLAAGERLVAKGRLHEAQHAVELTPDELVSLLGGGNGPSADEAAAHAHYRATHTIADAPPFLGGTPSDPPPAEWLPPAAARAARAIGMVMNEMFAARETARSDAAGVSGYPASPGEVVGVARLVLAPADMARVRKGDVLITRATAPSYNALLPLLSGIVTDRGGTLSHAAVVAREYGIPAVVGCGNATERIRDGARVRIDGASGTVEVLA